MEKLLMVVPVFVLVILLALILNMGVLLTLIHLKILGYILVPFVVQRSGIKSTKSVVMQSKLLTILSAIWEQLEEKLEIAKLLKLMSSLLVLLNYLQLLLQMQCLNLNTLEVLKNLLVNIWFSMFLFALLEIASNLLRAICVVFSQNYLGALILNL